MDQNRVLYTSIFLLFEVSLTIVNIFGNSIICYVMICKRKLKQTSNYFILSVAVSGLSIALITKPIALIWFFSGYPKTYEFCAVTATIVTTLYGAVILSLLVMSLDRFWAVCFPISYRNNNNKQITKLLAASAWAFALVAAFCELPVLSTKSNFAENCGVSEAFTPSALMVNAGITMAVCLVMIVLYGFIFCKIMIQQRAMQNALNLSSEIVKANEIRMAVTYSFIVGSYIVCWAPLVGMFTFIFWTGDINYFQGSWNMKAIQFFTLCTSHCNPAMNPFIYAYRIRDVRVTMKCILTIKTSKESPAAVDDDE